MHKPIVVRQLTIWSPTIPLRQKFRHAAAERGQSEPVVVAAELSDRSVGYGETHARPYVTGETNEDVHRTIEDVLVPLLVDLRAGSFFEAVEAVADLPYSDGAGRVATAARAAVELALLDAYSRSFARPLGTLAGWLGDVGLGEPGSLGRVRYSGVISGEDPRRAAWAIRKMRLFGLGDFKMKVGDEQDADRLAAALRVLDRPVRRGRATLRLDANGAWTVEQAVKRLQAWETLPIACVEQPVAKHDQDGWQRAASQTKLSLMADESLVTPEDGDRFARSGTAVGFNIRISKNGGLIPAIRLAMAARKAGLAYQLGCMVGETSILSAAGRWFLQVVPGVRFAEGSFGGFLLRSDVTHRSIRFGYGGRWSPLSGLGLGIEVVPERLAALSPTRPKRIVL